MIPGARPCGVRPPLGPTEIRVASWTLSYNDLMSLLVVFFVLLFALSRSAGERDPTLAAPATPVREAGLKDAGLTRRSAVSEPWRFVCRIRFRRGAVHLDPAQIRRLYADALPRLRGSPSWILLIAEAGAETERGTESEDRRRSRLLGLKDHLALKGIDKRRLLPMYAACGALPARLEKECGESPEHAADPCVSIYVAPATVPRLP
jgi:hypothetical protein